MDMRTLHSIDCGLPNGAWFLQCSQERLWRGNIDYPRILISLHDVYDRQSAFFQCHPELPLQSHPPNHALYFINHQLLPGNEEYNANRS